MPIYEFQCGDCDGVFEQMRRITDDTLPDCPACESTKVRKLISLSAFHLKGTGWYVTDYGGKKTETEASNGSESKDGGNGAVSTDGKNGGSSVRSDGKNGGAGESTEGKGDGAAATTKTSAAPNQPKPRTGTDSDSSR